MGVPNESRGYDAQQACASGTDAADARAGAASVPGTGIELAKLGCRLVASSGALFGRYGGWRGHSAAQADDCPALPPLPHQRTISGVYLHPMMWNSL